MISTTVFLFGIEWYKTNVKLCITDSCHKGGSYKKGIYAQLQIPPRLGQALSKLKTIVGVPTA